MTLKRASAFTLSELLIALAILGVIATFTIPKVLQAQQNNTWKAAGKEAAAIVAEGARKYKTEIGFTANTTAADILNSGYVNYVRIQTTGTIDREWGNPTGTPTGSTSCASAGVYCYVLHNGGILFINGNANFTGTSSTHALTFLYDPDGKPAGTTNGPGKSLDLTLFYNGRITSDAGMNGAGFCDYWSGCGTGGPGWVDPDWFSWN